MLVVITIIFIFFISLIACLEYSHRRTERIEAEKPVPPRRAYMNYHPYVMHLMPPMDNEPLIWDDLLHKKEILCEVTTNDLGFQTDIDFEAIHSKRTLSGLNQRNSASKIKSIFGDAKLVVITGGSLAWGVGASSQHAMISNVTQRELDKRAGQMKYKVVNQAMGGWVSFQELVGLSRWGRYLPIDWLLCLDGYNDAAITLYFQQGYDKHRFHDVTSGFLDAYLSNMDKPTFYRGRLENKIVELSALYRHLSGKKTIVPPWLSRKKIQTAKGTVFSDGTTWGAIEQSLEFLKQNHQQMVQLGKPRRHLFGIHPVPRDHRSFFGRAHAAISYEDLKDAQCDQLARLDALFQSQQNDLASEKNWMDGLMYFLSRLDMESDRFKPELEVCKEAQPLSRCNLNFLFPEAHNDQRDYFIDSCHLNDRGQRLLGQFFADYILLEDTGAAPGFSDVTIEWLRENVNFADEPRLAIQRVISKAPFDSLPLALPEELRKLNVLLQNVSCKARLALIGRLTELMSPEDQAAGDGSHPSDREQG